MTILPRSIVSIILVLGLLGLTSGSCSRPAGQGEIAFVGASSEVMAVSNRDNVVSIFSSDAEGNGQVFLELSPTYAVEIQRFGNNFIAPDEDSLVIFSPELQILKRINLAGNGSSALTESTVSSNGTTALFAFNKSTAEEPGLRRIVTVNDQGVFDIVRSGINWEMVACDDGSARWLEYYPDEKTDFNGPGKGVIVAQDPAGRITETVVDWKFDSGLSSFSLLSCNSEYSYVPSGDDWFSLLKVDGGGSVIQVSEFPHFKPVDRGRATERIGDYFYSFHSSGYLAKVDVPRGQVVYEEKIDLTGRNMISISYDVDKAIVVTQPQDGTPGMEAVVINLNDPSCNSIPIPIRNYGTSKVPGSSVFGGSYLIINTIIAIDRSYAVACPQ